MSLAVALLALHLLVEPPVLTPRLFMPAVATVPADCHTATVYTGSACASWNRLDNAIRGASVIHPMIRREIVTTVTSAGGLNETTKMFWADAGCEIGFIVRREGIQPWLSCQSGAVLSSAGEMVWAALGYSA